MEWNGRASIEVGLASIKVGVASIEVGWSEIGLASTGINWGELHRLDRDLHCSGHTPCVGFGPIIDSDANALLYVMSGYGTVCYARIPQKQG